jgi:hypothetical protein
MENMTRRRESFKNIPTNNSPLFIFFSGFLFDEGCNYRNLSPDILFVICTRTHLRFKYTSDFDKKGVLAWIRNSKPSKRIDKERILHFLGDKISFQPFPSRISRNATKKEILGLLGDVAQGYLLVMKELEFEEYCYIDLQYYYLRVSHITFRFSFSESLPYLWDVDFRGSNDLISWKKIHQVDKSINGDKKVEGYTSNTVRTWRLKTKKNDFFRYLKIPRVKLNPCYNKRDKYRTVLSGIELYGDLL